jgi:RsiW-degrading membrane proteinase PrsW (M82 family)
VDSLRRALAVSTLATPSGRVAFLLLALVLLATAFPAEVLLFRHASPGALGQALVAALWALALALPALALLLWLDRRERESPWLLAGVFLAGAAVSPGLAVVLEAVEAGPFSSIIAFNGLAHPATAGLAASQEGAKAVILLILFGFLREEFDGILDGVVYGILVGLGFALSEAALAAAWQGRADLAAVALRMPLFGLGGQALGSALTGAGLGLSRQDSRPLVRVVAPLVLLTAAIASHSLGDRFVLPVAGALGPGFAATFLGVSAAALVVQAPALALVAGLMHFGEVWEIRVIREGLRDEVGTPSVTPEEYQEILRQRPYRSRGGPPELVNAQDELALRKWYVLREGRDPDQDPVVQAWREDLRALREADDSGRA